MSEIDWALVDHMVSEGYIRRTDNSSGLSIYNYSERAQYEKVWNEATLLCRGLIVDRDRNVIARPFKKFFNHFEIDLSIDKFKGEIIVSEKLDGSLGILYFDSEDGRYKIATRGSFSSEQAKRASKIYAERYEAQFKPVENITYLFEIVYPENKIVIDYGDLEDIILLGCVETLTGRSIPARDIEWPGLKAAELKFSDLSEVIKLRRDGVEGVVIHFTESDERIKVKESEYMRIHLLLSNLSERRVWEMLSEGMKIDELLLDLPDEAGELVRDWVYNFEKRVNKIINEYAVMFQNIIISLSNGKDKDNPNLSRGDFAKEVATIGRADLRSAMFLLYDGKSVERLAWYQIRPEEHTPVMDGLRRLKL